MSEYIISPMWFYWVSVLDNIKGLLITVSILGCCVIAVAFGIGWATDADLKKMGKKSIKWLVACAVCLVVACLIPSEATMYRMMIAKYATHENMTLSVEAIKSAVDYIVEKMGAL